MQQKLAVASLSNVAEAEPGIVDIEFILADNTAAVLRMNVFVAQELMGRIAAIGR